jgi:hypothetical protein
MVCVELYTVPIGSIFASSVETVHLPQSRSIYRQRIQISFSITRRCGQTEKTQAPMSNSDLTLFIPFLNHLFRNAHCTSTEWAGASGQSSNNPLTLGLCIV